jgi:hypothetical protein
LVLALIDPVDHKRKLVKSLDEEAKHGEHLVVGRYMLGKLSLTEQEKHVDDVWVECWHDAEELHHNSSPDRAAHHAVWSLLVEIEESQGGPLVLLAA